ncbi:glycosyltransferase family 4 protein [Staphylococcus arlettae]|uniref:glycosyltransferase family 4 protein n=1 Tax=Staphylococcus arlettae TaxID=29378 RepID=UPI001E5E2DA0|nr:glycosyltransferase family 4 protein [Staphylococcus arlettae]MCD8907257.1 glycosyltransferase family 4 protein [Staphylococcus arlettae]
MKKKKLLILCQYFYPEYVSSATLPTQMAEDLVDKGMRVEVMCGWPYEYSNEKDVEKNENYKGISIKRLKYSKFNNKNKFGRIFNFFSLFVMFVCKMPKMLTYDHILVYSNPPILPLIPDVLYRMFNKQYSFVVYDIAPDNALKTGTIKSGSLIDRLMNYINKHVYKNAENIIVLGTEMKTYLLQNKISDNPGNIHVIPNWYIESEYDVVKSNEFKKLRNQYDKILLYSGNMGQLQDMETIVEFLKLNKNNENTLTILCGHGKKYAEVKKSIKSNEIKNVKMYEFLTGTDYTDVLKITDACFASLIPEGVGLGVPSKNYGYLANKKPLILIMDKHSDIVKHVETYNAGIQIDNGAAQDILNFITSHSRNDLQVLGGNAYQLFKDEYTRQHNTTKYYILLNGGN